MIVRTVLAAGLLAALSTAWAGPAEMPTTHLKTASAPTEVLTIPKPDVRLLVEEDGKAHGQPMRIGDVQRIDRALLSGGEARLGNWTENGDRDVWSLEITSEGAVSLDLQFSRFDLPDGAEVYLSNADRSYVLGPIRGSDALADGRYFTALIPGERMRLEVVADDAQRSQVDLHLAGVSYGYRGLFGLPDHPDAIRSGACNIDVACPLGDDWGDQIDGVGQYIFTDGGTYVCTGSLIANTGGTPTPYFITANHCVDSNAIAQSMRVYWNYQSATCRTPGSPASGSSLPRPATFNNGATLRMNYANSDTSLVELNAPVPLSENPFFVGWDRRNLATPGNPQVTGAVTIHHPAGHEKRISKDDDSLSVTSYLSNSATPTGTHYRIGNWEHGTTEGGSSGSALFSPDGHLIGTLHGGYASCSSNTQDWYGRIYHSWTGGGTNATRLSNWLDPSGTAAETLDGYRGEVLDDADLVLTLTANPDPVDIGDQLDIVAEVDNNGPGEAVNIAVTVSLPTGLAYDSTSSVGWTCNVSGSDVDCTYASAVGNGSAAGVLTVVADVVATETGTVTIDAEVSAANPDPVPGNNVASTDVEITGTPPLPDAIFCSGFEVGDDGSCAAPVDPDIVDSGVLNIAVPASVGISGFSINWVTGATCNCDDETGYHFNPYSQDGNLLAFWIYPNDPDNARGGMVVGGKYAALPSGTTIGPAATFESVGGDVMAAYMADWRAGTTGYFGFRFRNPDTNELNYGYVELATTAGGGFPMTIVRYWYNSAGNAITIP